MLQVISNLKIFGLVILLSLSFSSMNIVAKASECNVTHGASIAKKCVACHSFEKDNNKTGPSLADVIDRKSAHVKGFRYSRVLRNLNITWTVDNLDKFLLSPQKFARGTSMAFSGLRKSKDRVDLLCYLQSE